MNTPSFGSSYMQLHSVVCAAPRPSLSQVPKHAARRGSLLGIASNGPGQHSMWVLGILEAKVEFLSSGKCIAVYDPKGIPPKRTAVLLDECHGIRSHSVHGFQVYSIGTRKYTRGLEDPNPF